MHWVIWEITTIRDQDVFSGQWNGSDYYNLSEYKYNDSFWGINELWMQYYNIIKTANAAIESLDLYAENIIALQHERHVLTADLLHRAECAVLEARDDPLLLGPCHGLAMRNAPGLAPRYLGW